VRSGEVDRDEVSAEADRERISAWAVDAQRRH
jgi:hypothetical protein